MIIYLRALRPHQWVKNVLLFVPLALAHRVTDTGLLLQALAAFAAFSLCASSVYIINDILDREADRHHLRKRHRPFASGSLTVGAGAVTASACLIISAILAILFLPKLFLLMLAVYFLLANSYSLYAKKIAVLDVLFLAGLYALRLLSGAVATGDIVSAWLMGFSIFFFLSLALVKRYAELSDIDAVDKITAHGRGYAVTDMPLIHTAGIASGYISVLVLALYINGNDVVALYRHPWMLWLLGPCFIYWVTRIWLLAGRGQMHDDPIIFTFRDSASYITGLIVLVIIICAI